MRMFRLRDKLKLRKDTIVNTLSKNWLYFMAVQILQAAPFVLTALAIAFAMWGLQNREPESAIVPVPVKIRDDV